MNTAQQKTKAGERWRAWHLEIARGGALFLAAFAALNLVGKTVAPGFDGNLWWVDLRALPNWLADSATAALVSVLFAFALRPACGVARRMITLATVLCFVLATFVNGWTYLTLLARGAVNSGGPMPLSFLFCAGLIFIAVALFRMPVQPRSMLRPFAVAIACGLCFPILQVFAFGKTDYRRPAEVAVVFGARAYADGRASDALADRVRTACQLFRQGVVKRLVFSGGPGDGAVHETEAMRRLAARLGVPDGAIETDLNGLSTSATVANTSPQLARKRVLAVSEFYHLPRIKLAYQRAGLDVFTVPARPNHWLRAWPMRSIGREVPAFWVYYLRAITGRL